MHRGADPCEAAAHVGQNQNRFIHLRGLPEGAAKNPLASRKRLAKHRLPGVLAVAGTSVLAFRKPILLGDHSFQDIRMDCSKGRKPVALEEYGQGPPA
jgi:hypothetical protein